MKYVEERTFTVRIELRWDPSFGAIVGYGLAGVEALEREPRGHGLEQAVVEIAQERDTAELHGVEGHGPLARADPQADGFRDQHLAPVDPEGAGLDADPLHEVEQITGRDAELLDTALRRRGQVLGGLDADALARAIGQERFGGDHRSSTSRMVLRLATDTGLTS